MSAAAGQSPAGPPEPAAPRPFHFPEFRRLAAPPGGTVIAAQMPGRPVATALLVVDAGAVREPAGREGVGELTARMLEEGTAQRDAYGFAVAAERLGAAWSADVDLDSLRLGFEVPVGELPAAVALLSEAVREPAFRPENYQRAHAERVDELTVEWSQPGPRASAAFAAAVWAPDARYARPTGGDPDSVGAVTREDVLAFHATRVRPARATLVLAGDLEGIDVPALGEVMFGGWDGAGTAAGPETPADPARARGSGRRVVVVHRPGSVQSLLYMGHPAPPRRSPDYVAMTTMALGFGGMLTSRLNYRLREEKGYTYGANAAFHLHRDGGQFLMRAAVQREVTVPAIADAVAEFERTAADGLTGDELEAAKNYRVGIFPISFAQPRHVAGALGDLVVHGLADDYFERVRADVAALPLDAANRAAAERMHPDDLVTVVVGDADGIEGSLEQFGAVERVEG
jgi:zinc protease